ncbi:hypothetical protein EZS27_014780 [termite gut metagenome]|uniref:Uncharacterized protein n=1 Tax=termite gut metagenome TaxID=433724 RepID=A0A5J4RTY8_9ZZZZ
MEEKIKEVQEYFISKILNEEFEVSVEKSSKHILVLVIDEKYEFSIWAANNVEDRAQYFDFPCGNFITLGEFSDELKEVVEKYVVEYRSMHENRLKKKRIEELELELKELRSEK